MECLFLFIFVVDLSKKVVEVSKSEFIAQNASIKNEHENLRVLEKVGVSFGKVSNQLIDSLHLSLLKLNLVGFHLIWFESELK